MASAGTAYVDVEAKLDSFGSDIDAAVSQLDVQVEVGAVVDEAQAEIDSLSGDPISVDVGAQVDEAQAEIDSIDGGTTSVDVTADTEQAESSISSLGGAVDSAVGSFSDLVSGGGGGAVGGASTALAGFVGTAAEAVGASAALATGVGALGIGIGVSVDAAMDAQVVNAQLAQILETTGAGAFTTSADIQTLANEIENYSGASDETIKSSATLLLTFEGLSDEASINAGILDRATKATEDMAILMGGDATGAALRLGRALDNPAIGMSMLQRSGVSFTESQKEVIQSLYESGDAIGAQSALLDAVEGQLGGVAEAYGDTLSGRLAIAQAHFDDLKEEMGNAFLPTLQAVIEPTLSLADAIVSAASAAQLFTGPLSSMRESLDAGGIEGFTAQLLVGGPALNDWSSHADEAVKHIGPLADETQEAARGLDAMNAATNDYVNAISGLPGAQRALQGSFAELATAMTSSDATWNDQAVAMEGVVASTAETIAKQREMGATTAELDATIYGSIATLAQMRDAGQITGAQFDTLSQQVRDVPHEATTEVSAPGVDGTLRQLREVKTTIDGIDREIVVQVSIPLLGAIAADVAGAASALRSLRQAGESTAVGSDIADEQVAVVRPVASPTTTATSATARGGGVHVGQLVVHAPAGSNAREFALAVRDELRQLERAGR